MTTQDNSNLNSDKPEMVSEYTLCNNFIRQFKKYKLGMMEGEVWTIREQQALTASIISQPENMLTFINATAVLIMMTASEELDTPEDMVECVANFHTSMYALFLNVVVPLLKLPEADKKALRDAYMKKVKDGAYGAPYNLDFDMPDFKPGVNPDINPDD